MEIFNKIFSWLGDKLEWIINALIALLPTSPFYFTQIDTEFKPLLKWLNWLFPIGTFVSIAEAWVACIVVYYVYQAFLRWGKIIE